ncbi:hypothetical protein BGX28_007915 [Mortierella sp. GBA30]|nr:hypothetical protein BGX28_007915 [Mortierella sp. GBA30]
MRSVHQDKAAHGEDATKFRPWRHVDKSQGDGLLSVLWARKVFRVHLFNQTQIVVSGNYLLFLNSSASFGDAVYANTAVLAFTQSIVKSNRETDNTTLQNIARDSLKYQVGGLSPWMAEKMGRILEDHFESEEAKLIKEPVLMVWDVIALTSEYKSTFLATLFLGKEKASQPQVTQVSHQYTESFNILANNNARKNIMRLLGTLAKYLYLNPMRKPIRVLVDAAIPVTSRRFVRPPDDIGICFHTLDLNKLHPDPLLTERISRNDRGTISGASGASQLQEAHREEKRQAKIKSGEVYNVKDFKATDLDLKNDSEFSSQKLLSKKWST